MTVVAVSTQVSRAVALLSLLFRQSAHQPEQVSAIEEIRCVLRKQERELHDMRAKMQDNVSERRW